MPLLTRGGSNPKTFLVTLTLHPNIRWGGRDGLKAKDFHPKTEFMSYSINHQNESLDSLKQPFCDNL